MNERVRKQDRLLFKTEQKSQKPAQVFSVVQCNSTPYWMNSADSGRQNKVQFGLCHKLCTPTLGVHELLLLFLLLLVTIMMMVTVFSSVKL